MRESVGPGKRECICKESVKAAFFTGSPYNYSDISLKFCPVVPINSLTRTCKAHVARQTARITKGFTLKINGTQPLPPSSQTEPNKGSKVQKSAGSEPVSSPAAVTHFSQTTQDTSQDIDMARVAELREAIRDGKLDINVEKIADGLIASVQDLLKSQS